MENQDVLRSAIADVLDAMWRGDEDGTQEQLVPLLEADGIETDGAVMRAAVWELATANADMLRASADPFGADVPVVLELCDADGVDVEVDESEPALRAAVRTLLAMVNGHEQDARMQLDIVAEHAPGDMALVFVHTAGWTLALLDLLGPAGQIDTIVPEWLRRFVAQD
jgi:hypothetical protein